MDNFRSFLQQRPRQQASTEPDVQIPTTHDIMTKTLEELYAIAAQLRVAYANNSATIIQWGGPNAPLPAEQHMLRQALQTQNQKIEECHKGLEIRFNEEKPQLPRSEPGTPSSPAGRGHSDPSCAGSTLEPTASLTRGNSPAPTAAATASISRAKAPFGTSSGQPTHASDSPPPTDFATPDNTTREPNPEHTLQSGEGERGQPDLGRLQQMYLSRSQFNAQPTIDGDTSRGSRKKLRKHAEDEEEGIFGDFRAQNTGVANTTVEADTSTTTTTATNAPSSFASTEPDVQIPTTHDIMTKTREELYAIAAQLRVAFENNTTAFLKLLGGSNAQVPAEQLLQRRALQTQKQKIEKCYEKIEIRFRELHDQQNKDGDTSRGSWKRRRPKAEDEEEEGFFSDSPVRNTGVEDNTGEADTPTTTTTTTKTTKTTKTTRTTRTSGITTAEPNGPPEDMFTCGCCCQEVQFDDMVQCDDGHLFCVACLSQYVDSAVFGDGKLDLKCMAMDGCDGRFLRREICRVLPPDVIEKYDTRLQEDAVIRSDIEGLVNCPFCPFALILEDNDNPVFSCQNPACMKKSCRLCKEEDHSPNGCEEVEKKVETDFRTALENKLTELVTRECVKCKIRMMKDAGCNLMTCRCGQLQCYTCRQPVEADIKYKHFCQHVRDPGQPCAECNNCFLWEDVEQKDAAAVAQALREAQRDFEEKNRKKLKIGTEEQDEHLNPSQVQPFPHPFPAQTREAAENQALQNGGLGQPVQAQQGATTVQRWKQLMNAHPATLTSEQRLKQLKLVILTLARQQGLTWESLQPHQQAQLVQHAQQYLLHRERQPM